MKASRGRPLFERRDQPVASAKLGTAENDEVRAAAAAALALDYELDGGGCLQAGRSEIAAVGSLASRRAQQPRQPSTLFDASASQRLQTLTRPKTLG